MTILELLRRYKPIPLGRYKPIPLVGFIVVYIVIVGAGWLLLGEGWPTISQFALWIIPLVCGWAFRSR